MALVIAIAFGRGCAAAGLCSEMCFMLVRMPLRQKPGDVHSRNCRVGRRGEGSDQALIGAGGWARHSIKNTQRAGRTDPIDQVHVGGPSGDFKLQLGLAHPFLLLAFLLLGSTFTLSWMGWHSADGCYRCGTVLVFD
jgi:hypothetical protein